MNDNKSKTNEQTDNKSLKPNELGGVYFLSSIKIFDPNSKEIFVQKRGDN